MATLTLRPNADGDLYQLSVYPTTPTTHYDKVDEETHDGDSTYVHNPSKSAGKYDLYHLPDPPASGAISQIEVVTVSRITAGGNYGAIQEMIKIGGVLYAGNIRYTGTSYETWSTIWTTNPNTGVAWTWTDINNLQIGCFIGFGSGVVFGRITQEYVIITYTPNAPTVTTDPATGIGASGATLNGTLNDDGGAACDCGFEWGLTTGYGNTTPTQSRTTGQTFAQAISGLDPLKTYHFRAFATNSAGTSYGADRTFTTPIDIPVVTTNAATTISAQAATLNGTLDDDGGEACACGFEWGKSVAYGSITPTQSKTTGQTFSYRISPLDPDTEYHFRAFATNSAGTAHGGDRVIRTYPAMSRGYALERSEL